MCEYACIMLLMNHNTGARKMVLRINNWLTGSRLSTNTVTHIYPFHILLGLRR